MPLSGGISWLLAVPLQSLCLFSHAAVFPMSLCVLSSSYEDTSYWISGQILYSMTSF